MKFQLCMNDAYGSMSILQSGSDIQALIKRAKSEVDALNVENALTAAEKERNWEAMYIELLDPNTGELIEDAVYAGKDNSGNHAVTPLNDSAKLVKLSQCDVKVRAYLGTVNKTKVLYAKNERGDKILDDIKHSSLQNKQVYFIRKIG